ncbi:hypothetical protein HK102_006880, partial [Quaeritorhiza haematococci]
TDLILEDRYAPAYTTPALDTDGQDFQLIRGWQTKNITAFLARRPLKYTKCTVEDKDIYPDVPQRLVFAWGSSNELEQHAVGNYGTAVVDLGGKGRGKEGRPADAKDLVFKAPRIEIPTTETQYCYMFFRVNEPKMHVIAESNVLGSSTVHHTVLYLCPNDDSRFKDSSQVICVAKDKPFQFVNTCLYSYTVFGPGGGSRSYPPDFGKGIGGTGNRFFLMEIHYNNPTLQPNQVDNGTTVTLTVTPTLRKHETGVITLGIDHKTIVIPERQQQYTLINDCPSECTKHQLSASSNNNITALSNGGDLELTVLGVSFHMHNRGSYILRDGKPAGPVLQTPFFDFDHQMSEFLSPGVWTIRPGDKIVTACTWDTSKNSQAIKGGWGSEEEMCLLYVEYYPAIDFGSCNRRNFDSKQSLCGDALLPVEDRGSLDPSVLSCPFPAMSSNKTTNITNNNGTSKSGAVHLTTIPSAAFGVNMPMAIAMALTFVLQLSMGW